MAEAVLKYFKLRTDPFCLTPDTRLYCNLPIYEETIETILFSLIEGNSIVLVSGEVGLGKTMLCRKLLIFLDENFQTIFIPQPNMSERSLLNAIAAELGIDVPPLQDPYPLINAHLLESAAHNKKTILVVDEAQTIPDKSLETIRLLTNLETESEKLLQVVLFAQPEIQERLAQKKLRPLAQRVVQVCGLKPLSLEDTAAYLRKKLMKANCPRRTIFANDAVKLIWKKSKGVPRVINILSYKAMLSAFAREKNEISKKDVRLALAESQVPLMGIHQAKTKPRSKSLYILLWVIGLLCFVIILIISIMLLGII
ncbi:MAG: type secretory pathway, component ExeA [Gammaproteobacteria bacterium]|jgi:MSHA biogenesis protein MshM|nr:type secretory pathway, component ExeA [Gammaproteobacteria bacterium]